MSVGISGAKRQKILVLSEGVTLAHVGRPLVLTKNLSRSQFEVHFGCAKHYKDFVKGSGVAQHNLPCISPEKFQNDLYHGRLPYTKEVLELYLNQDMKLIEEVRPDLVLCDFRLTGHLAAKLSGVKSVMITNAYWSPFGPNLYIPPEMPMSHYLPIPLLVGVFNIIGPSIFKKVLRPMNSLRKENGLPPLKKLKEWYVDADYTLYGDIPSMYELKNLPENHHFMGPIMWEPEVPLPEWWDQLDRETPTVYLTLGSSGGVSCLSKLIEVLGRMSVQVMVSTAGRLGDVAWPKNFYVTKYLPGSIAASRSDLMISNGGGASYQALLSGVPVLSIPSNMDQFLNTHYMCKKGVALQVRNDRVTEKALLESIMELLGNPSYRANAHHLASELNMYDPALIFKNFLQEKVVSELGSAKISMGLC